MNNDLQQICNEFSIGYTERTYRLKRYPEGWQWRFDDDVSPNSEYFATEELAQSIHKTKGFITIKSREEDDSE